MIKEIIKYAVIVILSFIAGWILKPKQIAKPIDCPECPICPVKSDTCFTIQAIDTIDLAPTIKKGKKSKSVKVSPELIETNLTTDQGKIVEQNVFTKEFNNGLVMVWDTIIVQGSKIVGWKRSSQIDEVEVNKLIKVVEKIIIEPSGVTIKEVLKIVYMPQRFISLGSMASYSDNGDFDYGVIGGYQTKSGLNVEGGYTKNKMIMGKISFPVVRFKQKN